MRSGTIRLCVYSRIFILDDLRGMVLLRKWTVIYFSTLLLSILLCHIGLYCLFVFCFCYYFCNRSFQKTLWRKLSLVFSFYYYYYYYYFSPINTLRDLKRRGDYVKTSCPPWFGMEYTWSVCRDLAGGFFSTDIF